MLKKSSSRLEHQGIKVEFIGQIEMYYDRGNHHEFTSLVKELARPGEMLQNTSYNFEFLNVEKPYETYTGSNVRLRYNKYYVLYVLICHICVVSNHTFIYTYYILLFFLGTF